MNVDRGVVCMNAVGFEIDSFGLILATGQECPRELEDLPGKLWTSVIDVLPALGAGYRRFVSSVGNCWLVRCWPDDGGTPQWISFCLYAFGGALAAKAPWRSPVVLS